MKFSRQFSSGKRRQPIGALAVLLAVIPAMGLATEYDLSLAGNQSYNVAGDFGGTAIVADYWSQPTGTGVFDPFLSLDANGQTSTGNKNIESAYNADGHNALYLDGVRPSWNTSLHVGDLAPITINNVNYYGFILDANEPGGGKSVISVDNLRVYTSSTDNTASVQNNLQNLDNLGTLRWALNNPIGTFSSNGTPNFNINNWVKLDANQNNINKGSNGGSGQADMIVYVPTAAFGNAGINDFVWFYNLNGVHYSVNPNLGAQAGYEEWSAVQRLPAIPDNATTAVLIGLGLLCMTFARYRFRTN